MLKARWALRSSSGLVLAGRHAQRRGVLTLAIESSADDTAVAIVETQTEDTTKPRAVIHHHEKITADNTEWKGIQPRNSAISHQKELPGLIYRALRNLPKVEKEGDAQIVLSGSDGPLRKPTFIAATRGPGMRGGLSTGLDMAKGVSLAYDIPFMGVHHMQAHSLTPRLVSALSTPPNQPLSPEFPFRSLLVSGGHTMLVNSQTLTSFEQEAQTVDIAAGTCIDKMAKHILPESVISAHKTDTNYGAVLEAFAFPNGQADYKYTPPTSREELLSHKKSAWGWAVPPPLQNTTEKEFSFTGLDSSVRKIALQGSARLSETRDQPRAKPMDLNERLELARHAQRVMYEHIADRIHLVLKPSSPPNPNNSDTRPAIHKLVVSGGVASSRYLRHILHSYFSAKGIAVELIFPPVSLCTDNAIMIAWAGIEMWNAGYRSSLDCTAENRWPLVGEWWKI